MFLYGVMFRVEILIISIIIFSGFIT